MSNLNVALPLMFVTKDFDHAVIGNFMKKKHAGLTALIGKQESTYFNYSAADFTTLISNIAAVTGAVGTRFYLASYALTGEADVDAIVNNGYSSMLTLVVCPYDVNGVLMQHYYIINPAGGVLTISTNAANTLINAYQTTKLPFLQAMATAAGATNFVETKALSLPLDRWNGQYGFLNELTNQPADSISAFLGAYDKGYTLPGTTFDVSWQLTLVFCLVKNVSYNGNTYLHHYDIEDTPEYPTRTPAPAPSGGDTLNPCPPACCC